MKARVVVAMSGGVDSSVAAALLKQRGYEVIGITMCFSAVGGSASGGNLLDVVSKKPRCCGLQGIEDARRVAHKLGISHYVLNLQKDLEKWVIKDFCQEYLLGRTPNPCVRCNQYLKFGILLRKARALGAQYLATGHYARIVSQKSKVSRKSGIPPLHRKCLAGKSQKYLLKKAKDKRKDQSYFLYRLNQSQLKHILFPLGGYTKEEVRKLAREFKLPVAEKLASQDICFLPDVDYRRFIRTRLKVEIKPGLIVDNQGKVLGRHEGIAYYTIGQREGLGIARGYPLYITNIDYKNNKIVVGRKEDAYKSIFLVKDQHSIFKPLKKKVAATIKIRYNHQEAPAEVIPLGRQIKVCFKEPQFAITPGQSAVFYAQDTVLGGGIVNKILE